jgi:hypothetical protein
MKVTILLCFTIGFFSSLQGQLNCKNLKGRFGDSTVCYHQNGTKSTVDFNDRENDRYKLFIAYDKNGNKIFEGGHGYRHGGGSLYVKYYPNGCISSVRSTFQPDGGIQHFDVTSFFSEDGTFLYKEDNSWDRQVTVPTFIQYEKVEEKIVEKPKDKPKDSVHFYIRNNSGKKMTLYLTKPKDPEFKELVVLKRNKTFDAGKFEKTSPNMKIFDIYRIDVLPTKKAYRTVLINSPELNSNGKEYLLIVHIE